MWCSGLSTQRGNSVDAAFLITVELFWIEHLDFCSVAMCCRRCLFYFIFYFHFLSLMWCSGLTPNLELLLPSFDHGRSWVTSPNCPSFYILFITYVTFRAEWRLWGIYLLYAVPKLPPRLFIWIFITDAGGVLDWAPSVWICGPGLLPRSFDWSPVWWSALYTAIGTERANTVGCLSHVI